MNTLKNRPTTSRIPIYGGILGFVLCILISSVCGFSYLFDFTDLRDRGLEVIDLARPWLVVLAIFSGPLGAVIGAFVAADLFMGKEESKRVTHPLLAVLGGILGFTLGFWTSAALLFRFFTRQTTDPMFAALILGPPVAFFAGVFSAAGGVVLARYLLKEWLDEESSNLIEGK